MIGQGSAFPSRQVRSLFVSDVHLGSRHSKVESLLELLQHVSPERLYLVGDLLDGWQLCSRWHWQPCYHQLLHRLLDLHRDGTDIVVVAGNHDEFLRSYLGDWGPFHLVDATTHTCADGRELLVIHGDQFDPTQQRWPRLARTAGRFHEWILEADALLNRIRTACGLPQFRFNASVTNWFKHRIDSHRLFEQLSLSYARDWDCDGVICGHLHSPTITLREDSTVYANTGDWVDHCSAIVELYDGRLSLWAGSPHEWRQGLAAELGSIAPRVQTALNSKFPTYEMASSEGAMSL